MKIFTTVAIFLLISFSILAGVEGTVTATRLNIRVKPGTNYAVVAQVKKGGKLNVIKHEKGWYQVKAPQNTKVWVSSTFVENGEIKKEVYLRAGPSVAFSSFTTAMPGDKVNVIDKSRKGWLQITPPKGLTGWTSAKYIYLTPENAAKLTEKKSTNEIEKLSINDKKDNKKVAKTKGKLPLPFTESKGKQVSVEGFIVTLSKDATYVTHAIASRINGEYFPLCYIHSKLHNLKLWEGRRVQVTGTQRWVKNWQRPVLEVDKITPTW